MKCPGLHCPGCGHGGGGAALVVLATVILAAIARPVVHAAETVLEVALIVAGAILGLAALGGTAYAAVRLRRWHARTGQAIAEHARDSQALSGRARAAIEAPKVVIDGLPVSDEVTERH
jgi:hypothetical protein